MARRVADAQKYGLVFRAGPGKRFITPRMPIHGIVRVLQEIRGFLEGEPVGMGKAGTGVHKCVVA